MREPLAPLVRMTGIAKSYANGVLALEGFDLAVRSGEILSLVGPSGSGKSTALRILAGLSRPSRGAVVWEDGAGRDHRAETGFVFQDPTLMPWASVEDNVWLPLRLRGVSRADSREAVAESLALVGLADFARAHPRELSGGMRMRVSIARALSLKPRLLLMDEPFAALDEIARFRLNDDLLDLQARLGCTVVFVTHSIFESAYLSNRIAVMTPRPGRIAALIDGVPRADRDAEFRTSLPYMELCREVSQAMTRLAAPEAT